MFAKYRMIIPNVDVCNKLVILVIVVYYSYYIKTLSLMEGHVSQSSSSNLSSTTTTVVHNWCTITTAVTSILIPDYKSKAKLYELHTQTLHWFDLFGQFDELARQLCIKHSSQLINTGIQQPLF